MGCEREAVSVGRNLCTRLIETAADLRRYSALVDEFEASAETGEIAAETLLLARRLEQLVTPILAFEGEQLPALTAGRGRELADHRARVAP
jgi:hypothetical protein